MSKSRTQPFFRSVAGPLLVILIVAGCGGGDGNGGNGTGVDPEVLASLELVAASPVTKGESFLLTVTAVGNLGTKPLTSFSGTVSLGCSGGTITPASVSLANGRTTTSVTLSQEGQQTLTGTAQGKTGSLTLDAAPEFVLNGEVAFFSKEGGSGFNLWRLSQGAPDPVRLTNNNETMFRIPIWSPDGTRIAYESNRTGNMEIFIANADETGEVNISNDPGQDRIPSWSHDGSKIVFQSKRDGDWEIFVMNADGTAVTQLTDNGMDDGGPAWSPDGSKIAWSGGDGLDLMNPDGLGKTQLTDFGGSPVWSPDGSKIHFGHEGNLYVINPDATGLVQLTNTSRGDQVGDWSPDGTKIAFGSLQTGEGGIDWEVFLVNADGSGLTQLTHGPELSRAPSWSPDGVWIGFWRPQGIWAVHPISGVVLNLAHPDADTWYPAWR